MSDRRGADLREDQLRLLDLVVARRRPACRSARRGTRSGTRPRRGWSGARATREITLNRTVRLELANAAARRARGRPGRAGARDRLRHGPACRRAAAPVGGGRRAGRDRGLDDPCRGPSAGRSISSFSAVAGRRMGGSRVPHPRATWRGSDAGRSRPPRRAPVAPPRRGCLTWPPGRTHHRWKPPSQGASPPMTTRNATTPQTGPSRDAATVRRRSCAMPSWCARSRVGTRVAGSPTTTSSRVGTSA